jgi:archaellum component FlaC
LAEQKEQLEVFDDISKRKNKIEEELQKFEDLFSSKYAEKLGGMKVLINDAEEEEKNIQEKWEEASKDIKESKKPAVESGEEGQQKEKLQTKLDKLTAQKNAIEQKKKAFIELIFCSLIFAISKSFFAFFISKSFSLLDF